MEHQMPHIELINDYLNKKLSEAETLDFENRLQSDAEFNTLFEEHSTLLEGLKRQQLKGDILKAKQSYIKGKWFRNFGFTSGILVLTVAIIGYINLNPSNVESSNPTPNEVGNSEIVLDSVAPKEPIKDAISEDTSEIKLMEVKEVIKSSEPLAETEIRDVKIPKKQFQTLRINPKKDTTIVCKEGTKLTIKANSFLDKNNNPVTGNIDLKITEYYQLSDILLANLSTQSDGKLLETGGMLNVQALKGNDTLKLKPNAPIELLFPGQKKDMKLFSGEWKDGVINWTLSSVESEIEVTEVLMREEIEVTEFEEDIDVPFSVVEEVPIYPGCEGRQGNQQKKDCTSQAIKEFVDRNFNKKMADDIGLNGRQRINVIFKINKDGEITGIRVRTREPELELEAERVIGLLPKMLPGRQRGKAVSVPYSLPIIFEANGVPRIGRERAPIRKRLRDSINKIRDSIFEANLNGAKGDQVAVAAINQYILRTSELGWINCDRFVRAGNLVKYKLKVNEAKGVTRVSMVFKSMNSVLPSRRSGKTFDFNSVPKDEDVILIAVKKDEGKLYFDMIDARTMENPNVEFNFKEVDVKTLKREMEKLNATSTVKSESQVTIPKVDEALGLDSKVKNVFAYNNSKYRMTNCDVANEGDENLSKWEVDLFCCGDSFYGRDNSHIKTLVHFSLKSKEIDELTTGTYNYTKEGINARNPMTFDGSIRVDNSKMKIIEGKLDIDYRDSEMIISFNLKVEGGKSIIGSYKGNYNRY